MTLSDPAAPGGEKLPLAELNGALLLINVRDQIHDVATEFGPTDPISADVYVLDGTHAGESYEDTLIFPKVLVSSLKTKVGDWVQARLGQGIAKPGRSAPWLLNTISDDDKKVCAAAHARLTAPTDVEGF